MNLKKFTTTISDYSEKKAVHKEIMKCGMIATGLDICGILYFIIALLGGSLLWIESSKKVSFNFMGQLSENLIIDSSMRGLAVAGISTSIIVLLICFSLSRIIRQNLFIIKKIESLHKN